MNQRKFFRKPDILLIFLIIVICAGFFIYTANQKPSRYAEVIYNNGTKEIADLSIPKQININSKIVINIKDGAIAFTSSDCPDKTCVKTGYIKNKNQFAACLPNQVIIRILSKDGEVDMVTF